MTAAIPDAAATHRDAMAAAGLRDFPAALAVLDAALARPGADPALFDTKARVLAEMDRLDEAVAAERLAWAGMPGNGVVANNLASLLRRQNRTGEAVRWFRTAASLLDAAPEIACNLAEALAEAGCPGEAVAELRRALELAPGRREIANRTGAILLALGHAGAAERVLRASLASHPDDGAAWNDLGSSLRAQNRNAEAADCFAAAIRHAPELVAAHYNLGCLLLAAGRQDEARACQERALVLDPAHGLALWARCTVELPVLYDDLAQIEAARERYSEQLALLQERAAVPAVAAALAATIGSSQPFFLPYQGFCDRALQERYGRLVASLMPPVDLAPGPAGPTRVGIVSGFFCEHTVWRLLLKGWLRHFDPARFTVSAYHTGLGDDAQTALARQWCPRFRHGPAAALRDAILADRPHVLLYPEIGMDAGTAWLAAQRLAPVQCVAWGQPQTTGLPTMDVFLSSALMEPEGAARHYSERLETLPNLGICVEADERPPEPCTRAELGARPGATLFWCGQAVFKYLPQHDYLFVRIAERVGDCQFLFIAMAGHPGVTEQLRARLHRAFAAAGLDGAHHVLIVPPGSQGHFLGTVAAADLVLDSVGWSGGKSTLDMLAVAPAIVTLPGPMMRGRHTAAILAMLEVRDTIARDEAEFCAIAVRLARDGVARDAIRRRMAAARHRVLDDLAPIRAMEDVLAREVAATSAGGSRRRGSPP